MSDPIDRCVIHVVTLYKIRELHVGREFGVGPDRLVCAECSKLYPCPTIRAIDGGDTTHE